MMDTKLITLSGTWNIIRDPQNCGKENGWQYALPTSAPETIHIPDNIPHTLWTMQLSYANVFPKYHGFVWYYKTLDALPQRKEDERILLVFERAGFVCEAFVNGIRVGEQRSHEMRFSFDITDALKAEGENLLAVRFFEPRATGRAIEGVVLHEIPNGCFADVQAHMFGTEDTFCLECIGGILGAVHLRAVPPVRLKDIYVRPLAKSGDVFVTLYLENTAPTPREEAMELLLSDKKSGTAVCVLRQTATVPVGASEYTFQTKISNHQLWSTETPTLYVATASVGGRDHRTVRFGFRDFRIENGFFFLNGKRIFLKGAHSAITAANAVSMKALGFNTIRTIARAFTEELLDVCDEIGLLVIDAAATAWGMTSHEKTKEQMEAYNENLIRRHRNHPCIAAYCLLNELQNNDSLFYCAADALPLLRALAPDTLFLLHSGRWDKQNMLGSASNPGSKKWDTFLGAEGDERLTERTPPFRCDGYNDLAMGDIHIYMDVPVSSEQRNYFRTLGSQTRPIFVSESGIASQTDPMGDYLTSYAQKLNNAITEEDTKRLWDETEAFLDFYDLREIYPLAFDFVHDTQKQNGAQRALLYNIYRSNPMINGFSFTSFGGGNEGTLQGHHVLKDSLAYVIQQGHEPLRWSLFASERTVYADRPFTLEAVLCNEDVLSPGTYEAQAYVREKNRCVRKHRFTVTCPETGYGGMPPLAVPALKDTLSLPAGEYVFSVRLLQGGFAYDGDLKFTVAKAPATVDARVALWGCSPKMHAFLSACGISVTEFSQETPKTDLVLVGKPETDAHIAQLQAWAKDGATVIFTDDAFWEKNESLLKEIAGKDAYLRHAGGSIYHHDHICIAHPVFADIAEAGVLEFDQFGPLYPKTIFHSIEKPTRTLCAGIRIDGSNTVPGLSLGEYACGKGKYVLNTFRLSQALGIHPYADLMTINLIRHYAEDARAARTGK